MFDLDPWQPTFPMSNGWLDRKRKLAFGIGRELEGPDFSIWYFEVNFIEGEQNLALSTFQMKRSPSGKHPTEHARFEIRRSRIFALIDDTLSEQLEDHLLGRIDDLEPRYWGAVRKLASGVRLPTRRRQIVQALGGRSSYEQIVVAAVRACQIVSPLAPFQKEERARSVEVIVTD